MSFLWTFSPWASFLHFSVPPFTQVHNGDGNNCHPERQVCRLSHSEPAICFARGRHRVTWLASLARLSTLTPLSTARPLLLLVTWHETEWQWLLSHPQLFLCSWRQPEWGAGSKALTHGQRRPPSCPFGDVHLCSQPCTLR